MNAGEAATATARVRSLLYNVFEVAVRLVELPAIRAFQSHAELVAEEVDRNLLAREPALAKLDATLRRRLSDYHRMQAAFVPSVLQLKSERCLVESLIWAYRSLLAQGVDPLTLRAIVRAWPRAIRTVMYHCAGIGRLEELYAMIDAHHSTFMELAALPDPTLSTDPELSVPDRLRAPFDAFCAALLNANAAQAEDVVRDHVSVAAEIPVWWEEVITPALHRVGRLWALGEINEAHEHMATAIAFRIMARTYPQLPRPRRHAETVAVLVSPGEIHDIGATMVRDAVELSGYRVLFTGSDTPADTVTSLIKTNRVHSVLVSTTLATNLTGTSSLIDRIRNETDGVRIIVGGQAYRWDPKLWQTVGADALEQSLRGALDLVESAPHR